MEPVVCVVAGEIIDHAATYYRTKTRWKCAETTTKLKNYLKQWVTKNRARLLRVLYCTSALIERLFSMHLQEEVTFFIGDWQVSPMQGLVSRGDENERLEPKAVEVLAYLASRPGEVVSRDDLEKVV